jgi:putative Mg2+ transporter-C (MgtC) family protein
VSKSELNWSESEEGQDFKAAFKFLSLLCSERKANALVESLRGAKVVDHAAKDLLRAAQLPLLPRDEPHVDDDLKRIQKGKPLAPVLLIRGDLASGLPLMVADGYHRICRGGLFQRERARTLPHRRPKRVMDFRSLFGEPAGQSWLQLAELALAFILSASIGLEREIRQKSAGLRTYTLVGFSSALVMLVSKYGFTNILDSGRVVLDPSRIAAQIVSGIGFIGGGLIFVRKDIVRGLTTAATVWLTAAVGMACGAGLPILAIAVTFGHFVVVFVFPSIERRLPKSRWAPSSLQISYQDGRGVLREVLSCCTGSEFAVSRVQVERDPSREIGAAPVADQDTLNSEEAIGGDWTSRKGIVTLRVEVRGAKSVARLAERLSEIDGVTSVQAGDGNLTSD